MLVKIFQIRSNYTYISLKVEIIYNSERKYLTNILNILDMDDMTLLILINKSSFVLFIYRKTNNCIRQPVPAQQYFSLTLLQPPAPAPDSLIVFIFTPFQLQPAECSEYKECNAASMDRSLLFGLYRSEQPRGKGRRKAKSAALSSPTLRVFSLIPSRPTFLLHLTISIPPIASAPKP